jgi:hypothetical protein
MSRLRQVLAFFEDPKQTISIDMIARELDISPGQVESMIRFWENKGRLQLEPSNEPICAGCGVKDGCTFAEDRLECYTFVREDSHLR